MRNVSKLRILLSLYTNLATFSARTFSSVVKAPRWKAEPYTRLRADPRSAARSSKASSFDTQLRDALLQENHVSEADLKRLEFDVRLQIASRADVTEEDEILPDRDIVSCAIFPSGAKESYRYFPDIQTGCRMTERCLLAFPKV